MTLVNKIRDRLARASHGDRMYERPMDWQEAEQLLALFPAETICQTCGVPGPTGCTCGAKIAAPVQLDVEIDYPKTLADERFAHGITRKELAAAYGELEQLRQPKQLDVEIEALKKQRDQLLAAINFTIEYDTRTSGAITWLNEWMHGGELEMHQLEDWIAGNGTP